VSTGTSSEHQVNVVELDYNTFRSAEEVTAQVLATQPAAWSPATIDAVAHLCGPRVSSGRHVFINPAAPPAASATTKTLPRR
jgi:hypothetical protein